MNRFILNCILLVILSVPEVTFGVERRKVYIEGRELAPNDSMIVSFTDNLQSLWCETRVASMDNGDGYGISESKWRMSWIDRVSKERYDFIVGWGNTDYTTIYDQRFMRLTLMRGSETLWSKDVIENVDMYGGYNSVALLFNKGKIDIKAGNRVLESVSEISLNVFPEECIYISSNHKADVREVRLIEVEESLLNEEPVWTIDSLVSYLSASTDPHEGFWEYLDQEIDLSMASLGGKYILAVVKSDDNDGYDIIYVEGAKVGRNNWSIGMKKGELKSTIFLNHYHLYWFDSSMNFCGREYEFNADYSSSMWTFNFPLYSTRVRFSLKPLNK